MVRVLNKFVFNGKKLFRAIKSIDENNRTITLGYYKDIEGIRDYGSIFDIRDLWKNDKISTVEYLMWINIYGNRSFRDIAQFPVFPWLLSDYNTDTFEEVAKNPKKLREFRLCMGMIALEEKGKERQLGYIDGYRNMVAELVDDEIITVKPQENEEFLAIEQEEKEKEKEKDEAEVNEKEKDKKILTMWDEAGGDSNDNKNEEKDNNSKGLTNWPKIKNYNFNIEKLYGNTEIELERIPYFYGSHYSNAMYVSHFLGRLFPYAFTMIEIQGTSFDCPDRLFLSLNRAFFSSTTEKCDLRELIPEFYNIPELFLNINKLDLGEINIKDYLGILGDIDNTIIEKEKENDKNKTKKLDSKIKKKMVKVENVVLPKWSKQDPYNYILKTRGLLEKKNINLNPWIDLIFGYTQRGIKAQLLGNLFSPYTYDGVINKRLKPEDLLAHRSEFEYQMKYFELGITPSKVFEKRADVNKKGICGQISKNKKGQSISKSFVSLKGPKNIFISNLSDKLGEIFTVDKNYNVQKIFISENDKCNAYEINEIHPFKALQIKKIINYNTPCELIIKTIFKGGIILFTGYYDGSLYVINTINKRNENFDPKINTKLSDEENLLLKIFGNCLITSLEISKDEKYMICGTEEGDLIIYSLNYNNFYEGKNFITLLKIIQSHPGYKINSISINNDLNLFADCAYDGFVHIYNIPKLDLVNSIYIDNNNNNKKEIFELDHIFLTAQPLASIVIYSNKNYSFKSFNINGHELSVSQNDKEFVPETGISNFNSNVMNSPIVFTDFQFVDHLAYVFNGQYILIRKFPLMENVFKIEFNKDSEMISMIDLSLDYKYLYAL